MSLTFRRLTWSHAALTTLSLALSAALLSSCDKKSEVSATTPPPVESAEQVVMSAPDDPAETTPAPNPPPLENDEVVVVEQPAPPPAPETPAPVAETPVAAPASTTSGTSPTPPPANVRIDSGGGPKIAGVKTVELMAPPDPYAKFRGIDNSFGSYNWKDALQKINRDVDPNAYSDLVLAIPLLTGQRICDGVMAIKVKDAEALREAANDIEVFARKLGVAEEDLVFAKTVRDMALKGEWLEVYTNLSFLQNRVQKTMRTSSALTSALVMIGGWMQGARYVTSAVITLGDQPGKKPHPSYFLREPVMVQYLEDQIHDNLKDPKAAARANDLANIEKKLQEIKLIVNIDIDAAKGRISAEDLQRLNDSCEAIFNIAGGGK